MDNKELLEFRLYIDLAREHKELSVSIPVVTAERIFDRLQFLEEFKEMDNMVNDASTVKALNFNDSNHECVFQRTTSYVYPSSAPIIEFKCKCGNVDERDHYPKMSNHEPKGV